MEFSKLDGLKQEIFVALATNNVIGGMNDGIEKYSMDIASGKLTFFRKGPFSEQDVELHWKPIHGVAETVKTGKRHSQKAELLRAMCSLLANKWTWQPEQEKKRRLLRQHPGK